MFSLLFRPKISKRQQKKLLLALWHEVNANLECFYVLDQRQFITNRFDLEAWEDAKQYSKLDFPSELVEYAQAIAEFNNAFNDMKTYEEFYSSSIENKTRPHAEVLHVKQEALDSKIENIKNKILSSQQTLRSMLENAL